MNIYARKIRGSAADRFCYLYGKATARELGDVYKTIAPKKGRAFRAIQRFCADNNYYGLKIITHNSFQYSVGYMINPWLLCVETANNRYLVEIDTMEQLHYVKGEF